MSRCEKVAHASPKLVSQKKKKNNAHSVRPCKGGGTLVGGTFDKPFSMEMLRRILRDTGKWAEKLGVARLFHGGCGIALYRAGLKSIDSNRPKKPSGFLAR